MSFDRGYLRKPAVTRLLNTWQREDDARQIAERNDAIFAAGVKSWFEKTERRTAYVIRRKADGLYFAGSLAPGSMWVGSPALAATFEFQTIACATVFLLDEQPDLFDIVPVAGR